ncbi:MAG: type IV pilus secretin PilQ [Deltaproteobacteria bacterium]|nr:type IV pilus secretin PilQ [Deltaproteobacteria bacterium]
MKWMTKQSIALALVLAVMAGFIPCMARIADAAPESGRKSDPKLAAIESISVSGEGDRTELAIKLSSPATYTSYKTTAPLRLVVDLSQTTQGSVTAPLVIDKGNFKTVTVNRYDTDAGVLTRVDIELAKDAEAVISTAPDQKGELTISFPAPSAQVAATADAAAAVPAAEPAAAKEPEPVVAPPEAVAAPTEPAVPPAETPVAAASAPEAASPVEPAKTPLETPAAVAPVAEQPVPPAATPEVAQQRSLTAVSVKDGAIFLAVQGGAKEFKSFRLSKPERFVIDLFGVKSSLANRIVPINAAGIALARIGIYPGKVRIVFDAVNGSFSEAVASGSDEGITVTLNAKPAAESPAAPPVEAASEKAAEVPPQPEAKPAEAQVAAAPASSVKSVSKPEVRHVGPAGVEAIDFQVIDGISRVAVKVAGDVVVDAPVKTPGFVTLTIKNAGLPKRLQRSLEAQGFISPVLRVTPLLAKTRKGTDTRIRIALRTAAPYEFRQEGDMLFVDFKHPEGLTAEKAAAEPKEPIPQIARAAKAAPARDAEIPSELAQAAEPAERPLHSTRLYKGRKVTLEFADAEVRKIFQLLAEVSNKNFVLGDDVGGTISIKLVNVPWDQALDIILDTKGLDKREDGNIIIIKGKGKFKSQADEELEIKKQLFKAIELKTETFSVNYADIGSIVGQFTALKSDRGTIAQDTRTNKVIVKDIPQAIEDMRKLKDQLDVPEKQVMIEARIVEATSTFTRSLGVNWGVHYRDGSASFLGINSLDTGFGGLTSAPPTVGTGASPGGTMGISFGTLTSNIQLDMRLNAAASAGLIKIVSTPKVATLNNKTARITQGQQIPYTSSTSDKVETKFVEAALSLEVTPHINPNGTIGMKIDAKNDSPGASTGTAAPPINKKQATTEMLLRDGETTVIGGIYVDSDTEADDGVPFLMDIPFLGKLFKSNSKQKTKTELLIFITPRILGTI